MEVCVLPHWNSPCRGTATTNSVCELSRKLLLNFPCLPSHPAPPRPNKRSYLQSVVAVPTQSLAIILSVFYIEATLEAVRFGYDRSVPDSPNWSHSSWSSRILKLQRGWQGGYLQSCEKRVHALEPLLVPICSEQTLLPSGPLIEKLSKSAGSVFLKRWRTPSRGEPRSLCGEDARIFFGYR